MQQHLPSFERMWTDTDSGSCLPKFVTEELQKFLTCGILACGFAQMHCDAWILRYLEKRGVLRWGTVGGAVAPPALSLSALCAPRPLQPHLE
ncbi:MAG: hypothetical protein M3Y08_17190, partial [Fibrobacterota bacterium]|nr:hypothetical protein [Fibrobacterota bacterium]